MKRNLFFKDLPKARQQARPWNLQSKMTSRFFKHIERKKEDSTDSDSYSESESDSGESDLEDDGC